MDPVTHALAGAVVATFSGHEFSLSNPLYLGCILGSVAPDLDIVFQIKGDMSYLRHHRGFSHSLPGIVFFALIIAGILAFFFPVAFLSLFLWTLVGAFSHIFLDLLNSYGVKILWPFLDRRLNLGILNSFDPFVIVVLLGILIGKKYLPFITTSGSFLIVLYFVFRYIFTIKVRKSLFKYFGKDTLKAIVMPSIISILSFHFLVEKKEELIVGEFKMLSGKIVIKKKFKKQLEHPLITAALNSKLGKMFREFTPLCHVFHCKLNDGHLVKFIDLRYLLKDKFMHSATCHFDEQKQFVKGFFHPYNERRAIKILEIPGR